MVLQMILRHPAPVNNTSPDKLVAALVDVLPLPLPLLKPLDGLQIGR